MKRGNAVNDLFLYFNDFEAFIYQFYSYITEIIYIYIYLSVHSIFY
jgi:hypothetical protein